MNKIAIIEDDIDICNMIAKFLENNKYIVHYALNGAEGIELCKSLVPDLIILDIMLPRLNGNDVLQRLRKFTNAPVIVVSAKTMVQTKIDLLKLGADDYMTKPFDLHELLARIEANLKRTSNTSCQNDTLTYRDIAIASGQSRIKFFVAKYIVISITSIFLYFSFIMIAFIIECAKFNIPIQLFPMLKIAGLNCMIMGAFIGITLMLCVIFKHTAIVVGAMSLFTFSGPLIYMMTWDNMSTQSWRVLTYLKINPMYYWMNTCSYNMINNLEINILIYFVGTVIITFLVSALILRKQEIR